MNYSMLEMLALANVFNDASTLEQLQNRLIELKDAGNNIQARADAEKRELTADEQKEISEIFASFENVEADIARREQLDAINAKISAPAGRKSNPELVEELQAPAAKAAPKIYAQPRSADANKWGFRSQAEYLSAVVASSRRGATADPRLIANAPSTYGSEGTGADGGFAIPPDFRSTIVTKVMGENSLVSLTDQQITSSNAFSCPADETSDWQSSGGIQAYWESEGGQKQQSKPALVEKNVKANKIIALVPLTDELLEDAPGMANYVNKKAPEKINFRLNDAIINGSGVGMPLGIMQSPGTVVVTQETSQTADTVNFTNVVKMWNALTPAARFNARWVVNPDVEMQLMTMSFPGTGTAVPAYLPPGGLSASPYGTLLGKPVIPSEACKALGDKGDIVLGDFSNYLTVVKAGGIRTDVSIHLFFDYDITSFRFVLRIGGQPWWNSTIAPFQSGSTARGFFVTLADRTGS
jgi:HK97 family phage major capsid protein